MLNERLARFTRLLKCLKNRRDISIRYRPKAFAKFRAYRRRQPIRCRTGYLVHRGPAHSAMPITRDAQTSVSTHAFPTSRSSASA